MSEKETYYVGWFSREELEKDERRKRRPTLDAPNLRGIL